MLLNGSVETDLGFDQRILQFSTIFLVHGRALVLCRVENLLTVSDDLNLSEGQVTNNFHASFKNTSFVFCIQFRKILD
jgi:hypothetical protein